MSELASAFKAMLEKCQIDAVQLTPSKDLARDLLEKGLDLIETMRRKGLPESLIRQVDSLEFHLKLYYDRCVNAYACEIADRQFSIDGVTKSFFSLKPYLVDTTGKAKVSFSRKVFIVHGKDEVNKNALKTLLVRWGFDPIILAEQPNRGRVLIEKLLAHSSDVGFAFVLMTPDDMGSTSQEHADFFSQIAHTDYVSDYKGLLGTDPFKGRVRQNVMFEYGLFVGSLGRERVCVLVGGDLEIPSDVLGFGYTPFRKTVTECQAQIKEELKAAGYGIPE